MIWRMKMVPSTATTTPARNVTVMVVPAISLTLSSFLAPQAWPMSTVEPEASPMMKLIRKNRMGKNAAVAASASTPTNWPI